MEKMHQIKPKRIVLAYSGGLDTSIILTWLKETYHAEVVACYVDLGQKEDTRGIREKAKRSGAISYFCPDVQAEYIKDFCWPALQSHAVYEHNYLLGTALARPLIAKKLVEVARKVKADAICHGATGKGNDQVRFELSIKALAPDLKIIAPWRIWDFKGREDLLHYASLHNIQVGVSRKKPYSSDANLWHISQEGGTLEELDKAVPEDVYTWTLSPEKAPSKPLDIEINFIKGIPTAINGRKKSPVAIVQILNQLGGKHAVGRVDMVENRLIGLKSRGVYECPAATILYKAHRELEVLALDRETLHFKEQMGPKFGELAYYGQWFSPLMNSIQAFVTDTQKYVTGSVKLRLYKGNMTIMSRKCEKSLYSKDWVTFEADSLYNQYDAEGFINLFGLPLKIQALLRKS